MIIIHQLLLRRMRKWVYFSISMSIIWISATLVSLPLGTFHEIQLRPPLLVAHFNQSFYGVFCEKVQNYTKTSLNTTVYKLIKNKINSIRQKRLLNLNGVEENSSVPDGPCSFRMKNYYESHDSLMESACMENWPDDLAKKLYTISSFVIQFIIPYILISYCYLKIFRCLNTHYKRKTAHHKDFTTRLEIACNYSTNEDRINVATVSLRECSVEQRAPNSNYCDNHIFKSKQRAYIRKKTRVSRMLIIMMTSFCLCWMPLHSLHLALDCIPNTSFFQESPFFSLIFLLLHMIAMSSTILNPALYFMMNRYFRKYLSEDINLLKNCFWGGKHAPRPIKKQSSSRVESNNFSSEISRGLSETEFNQVNQISRKGIISRKFSKSPKEQKILEELNEF